MNEKQNIFVCMVLIFFICFRKFNGRKHKIICAIIIIIILMVFNVRACVLGDDDQIAPKIDFLPMEHAFLSWLQ